MQKLLHNRTPYIGALLILVAFMLSAFIPAIKAQAAQITPKAKTWSALQDAINDAESDDTIILNADVTAGKTDTVLTVPDGSVLTLDLNGHTIDRALAEPGGNAGSAIHVQSGAMLTVTDSSEDAAGKITGGYAPHGGGINNSGTLIVEDGCITGNAASDSGGGVVNNGNLIVKGGKITENKALTEAGGVFNADKRSPAELSQATAQSTAAAIILTSPIRRRNCPALPFRVIPRAKRAAVSTYGTARFL